MNCHGFLSESHHNSHMCLISKSNSKKSILILPEIMCLNVSLVPFSFALCYLYPFPKNSVFLNFEYLQQYWCHIGNNRDGHFSGSEPVRAPVLLNETFGTRSRLSWDNYSLPNLYSGRQGHSMCERLYGSSQRTASSSSSCS